MVRARGGCDADGDFINSNARSPPLLTLLTMLVALHALSYNLGGTLLFVLIVKYVDVVTRCVVVNFGPRARREDTKVGSWRNSFREFHPLSWPTAPRFRANRPSHRRRDISRSIRS